MTWKTDGLGLSLFPVIDQQRHSGRLLKLSVSYLEIKDSSCTNFIGLWMHGSLLD